MQNPAYFTHYGFFRKKLLSDGKTSTFEHYKQERIAFTILQRVKSITKLNQKLQKQALAYIKLKFSSDDILMNHFNKEYGVPLEL
jgi:hypothetical protein